MPRLLSSALTWEKNLPESATPLTMLAQLDVAGVGVAYRLANYTEDIAFHGLTFLRSGFDVDTMEDATTMTLVRVRVTFQNVDQAVQSLLENYWVYTNLWTATLWYPISVEAPDELPLSAGDVFTVVQVATNMVGAVADLMAEGITLTGTVPKRRYTALAGFPGLPKRMR